LTQHLARDWVTNDLFDLSCTVAREFDMSVVISGVSIVQIAGAVLCGLVLLLLCLKTFGQFGQTGRALLLERSPLPTRWFEGMARLAAELNTPQSPRAPPTWRPGSLQLARVSTNLDRRRIPRQRETY
jgi:hypothetical protein